MDVDFLVQDTYSLVRPQWKVAGDIEEAGRLFSEAIAQNYKVQDGDKGAEIEDDDVESISSDANGEEGLDEDGIPDIDDGQSSAEEAEPFANVDQDGEGVNTDSEDEEIFVARQEEERDPEAEADFDRAFEKMMAESMESRRFERKALFDIPLPMRPSRREQTASDETFVETPQQPPNTMAFSLMTKKGNRQQVSLTRVCRGRKPVLTTMSRHARLSCHLIPALQSP
jgi:regulator of nonsense transcripts 2